MHPKRFRGFSFYSLHNALQVFTTKLLIPKLLILLCCPREFFHLLLPERWLYTAANTRSSAFRMTNGVAKASELLTSPKFWSSNITRPLGTFFSQSGLPSDTT